MERTRIQQIVEENQYLASKLYCRGYLFTSRTFDINVYPFGCNWKETVVFAYRLYTHYLTKSVCKCNNDTAVIILGNAYNPFTMDIDEEVIADKLLNAYGNDFSAFLLYYHQLTGVFTVLVTDCNGVKVFTDPVGLYATFYLESTSDIYVSSHSNLIGDLLGLVQSDYMKRLKKCKTYHYFGYQLPGIITQFNGVFRVTPNHYADISDTVKQIRFYEPHSLDIDEKEITERLTNILENTMECIVKKWKKPAISLTGGCDSKTTLAAAHNVYDRLTCFSYDSQPNEQPDADAAELISRAIDMPFTYYHIPYDDMAYENIEDARAVMLWNCGDIRYNNANDVRKRLYLDCVDDFDVEIKSWASEVGRSRYTKRYAGKRYFGKKPTPRKCTTFYKFLLFDRVLVNRTDRIFKDYLRTCYQPAMENPIPWQDQFYWEWHWPSRDGISLTCEQQFSNEITVPYNNRLLLELLLSVDELGRINDRIYTRIRKQLDGRIDRATSAIVDVNHTKKRAIFETVYYYLNNLLPF